MGDFIPARQARRAVSGLTAEAALSARVSGAGDSAEAGSFVRAAAGTVGASGAAVGVLAFDAARDAGRDKTVRGRAARCLSTHPGRDAHVEGQSFPAPQGEAFLKEISGMSALAGIGGAVVSRTASSAKDRSVRTAARTALLLPAAIVALALAACAPPGGAPGAPGAAAPGGAVGQGPATSMPGAGLQMPQIRWPVRAGAQAGAVPTGAAGQGGAPLVTDPFAGQGVRQPAVAAAGGNRSAAAPAATAAAAPAATSARSHTVASGETAWSIARQYGVTIQALAQANGLSESMSVRAGQRLAIPASGSTQVAAVTAPGAGSPTPQPPSAARPLPDEKTQPASTPAPKTDAPDLGRTRTAASGSGRFSMPASGSITRAYKKGTNEGIDIAAAPGSAVKAAGAGTVAAVTRDTDGVPIVVVRHDGGLMTVYAGIDKLSVAKGDSVKAGQSIGAARNSGVVHFEVRKGFDSVDPEDYL